MRTESHHAQRDEHGTRDRGSTERIALTLDSPIGPITLVEEGGALVGVFLRPDPRAAGARPVDVDAASAPLAEARAQLAAYLAGARRTFDLPLAPRGTAFQRSVWAVLTRIPFGETRSYADVARALGRPEAVRAVGAANGQNPLSIVVPCHRVIGTGGALTGYAGGLETKAWLLAHEERDATRRRG